ncbi:MAG: hypothetical protein U5J99_10395 [Parvularculaceae bacterium]|nr:hypothetical protein [Parvularculaceae bacterium]
MNVVWNVIRFIVAGWPTRILAALVLVGIGAGLYIVALISVIGIPIALMLLALPAAAVLYVASELIHQVSRLAAAMLGGKPLGHVVAAALVVAGSFLVAQVANFRLGAAARSLDAGDFDKGQDVSIRTFALTGDQLREINKFPACDELCLQLLISGAAKVVLISGPVDPDAGPAADAPAIAARFEQRATCAEPKHFRNIKDEHAKREASRREKATFDEARRRQEAGLCLIETKSRLGAADAVLAEMKTKTGKSAASAGFDPFADTASATQLSLYRRAGGRFNEVSRRTIVRYEPLLFLAAPTYLNSYGMDVKVGFARYPAYINAKGRHYGRTAQAEFLTTRLGIDLERVSQ